MEILLVLRVDQLLILVNGIKELCTGGQLQDISLSESHLFLQHYIKKPKKVDEIFNESEEVEENEKINSMNAGEFTIGVELRPLTPRLGYFYGPIPKMKFLVKPIVLFLKAHARNLRLKNIIVEELKGRIVRLQYEGSEGRFCEIEIRLIPHGVNVIISSQGKSISLFPVKELPQSTHQLSSTSLLQKTENFEIDSYLKSWFEGFNKQKASLNKETLEQELERKNKKEIQKKEFLIEKLVNDLKELTIPWNEIGEFLKGKKSVEVPGEWITFVNPSLSVSVNMQLCFEKHKSQEKRRSQVEERIKHLRLERDHLINRTQQEKNLESLKIERPVRSLASELLSRSKAKGRKLLLTEGIEAVFGKSAKDNLALLRRAQPWDLWLHLRDLPGSHLIIRRARNKNVDHIYLIEAARWLLNETLGKNKAISGERYDIIVTECRYVKPIKGDRLGRVSYQNEMTLTLKV